MRKYLLCLWLLACADSSLPGPLQELPVHETLSGQVEHPVQIIRDEHGVPHLYGSTLTDVAYAQGYVMAQDRWVQMDLARRHASGTLAELFGALDEGFIDHDIQMRVHRLRATSERVWELLRQSTDPDDALLVQVLERFAAGVNAYLAELKGGAQRLPPALALVYDVQTAPDWTPVDSLVLGRLQAFELSYDADTEIVRTQAEAAAYRVFDQGDARLRSRRGLASDLFRTAALDPAFILPDAQGCGSSARAALRSLEPARTPLDLRGLLLRERPAELGSNSWIVSPRHSQSGRPLLANDTHLSLGNPAVFYLVHLQVRGDMGVMGVQFPGLPGVMLGMNERLAWGSTTTYADVTDVYEERILSCDGRPCVQWRDPREPQTLRQVPLEAHQETIRVGRLGRIQSQRTVTLWWVPHHGPLLPRIVDHQVLPPGPVELSVRYTGHEPSFEARVLLRLARARSVQEAMEAIERDFHVGSQNWVFIDAEGHIGYTSHVALPRRPPGSRPWIVQPGDGSAEWLGLVPAAEQPRAIDPSCGLLVTANNDPIGGTSDDPPALYHGWNYDVGARAGRITMRLREEALSPERLTPAKMQQIQADHRSFLGGLLLPLVRTVAGELLAEVQRPGSIPELTEVAREVDEAMRRRLQQAHARLSAWKLSTPAGLDHEASPAEVEESVAATIFNVWLADFHARTLADEFQVIDEELGPQQVRVPRPGASFQRKLLVTAALHPDRLALGRQPSGDSLLFDDLRTRTRLETRREVAARSLLEALRLLSRVLGEDPGAWRWGRLHRLTLSPILPVPDLQVPGPRDPMFPTGVPRHGDLFAVDVGSFGVRLEGPRLESDFAFRHGAAMRFVAELGSDGPRGWNVLPGGQRFDPGSPHHADQFELWRHNLAFPLPFRPEEVAASARREAERGEPARVDIVPPRPSP
ncbi:MAG: penicillin acylase family protein [Myxococcota bacterium]|nr:penicillin acylase family protein [Myxococcota bacterium]